MSATTATTTTTELESKQHGRTSHSSGTDRESSISRSVSWPATIATTTAGPQNARQRQHGREFGWNAQNTGQHQYGHDGRRR